MVVRCSCISQKMTMRKARLRSAPQAADTRPSPISSAAPLGWATAAPAPRAPYRGNEGPRLSCLQRHADLLRSSPRPRPAAPGLLPRCPAPGHRPAGFPALAGSPGPARCVRLHSARFSSASPCRIAAPCRPGRILRLCPRPNLPPARRLQARSVGYGSPPPGLAAPACSLGRSATSRPRERPLARATAGCPPAAQENPRASLPFAECAAPGWPRAGLASLRPSAPVAPSGSPGRLHGPALANSPDRLPRPPAPTPATRPRMLPRTGSLAAVPGRLLQHPAAGSPAPSPAGSCSRRHPPAAASQLVGCSASP
nr:translation initiation factor IF-2-like [Aegilops tauschii subsp. strangulata]